ncbi:MAG: hypothetical protein ACRCT8_00685 [Lacipirellulaceae bacterium]
MSPDQPTSTDELREALAAYQTDLVKLRASPAKSEAEHFANQDSRRLLESYSRDLRKQLEARGERVAGPASAQGPKPLDVSQAAIDRELRQLLTLRKPTQPNPALRPPGHSGPAPTDGVALRAREEAILASVRDRYAKRVALEGAAQQPFNRAARRP